MQYNVGVFVPADHHIDDKIVVPLNLTSGIITNIKIMFDPSNRYNTYLQIWDRANQVLPYNHEGSYVGNDQTIDIPMWYNLDELDNELYVVAWNSSGLYSHFLLVSVTVKSIDEPDVNSIMQMMIETIDRLITLIRSIF